MPATFIGPKSKVTIVPEQSERMRRTLQQYSYLQVFAYKHNLTTDKQEVEASLYKKRFPNNVKRQLLGLVRVKLPRGGQFELDYEGKQVDHEHRIKEALVYAVQETVYSPQNPDTEQLAHCSTIMGMYRKPRAIFVRDDLGNPIEGTHISGHTNMFYIPWDNGRSAQAVIDEFGGSYRSLSVAIAAESSDSYYSGNRLSVFNLQEWLESSFDDLVSSNRAGFLRNEFGGVVMFKKDKAAKQKKMQQEIDEFNKEKSKSKGKENDKTKS